MKETLTVCFTHDFGWDIRKIIFLSEKTNYDILFYLENTGRFGNIRKRALGVSLPVLEIFAKHNIFEVKPSQVDFGPNRNGFVSFFALPDDLYLFLKLKLVDICDYHVVEL